MLEVYFDIQNLYLVEKNAMENISVRVEIRIIKAQKILGVIFSGDFLAWRYRNNLYFKAINKS